MPTLIRIKSGPDRCTTIILRRLHRAAGNPKPAAIVNLMLFRAHEQPRRE